VAAAAAHCVSNASRFLPRVLHQKCHVFSGPEKRKRLMLHGLGEFVLQK